MSNNVQIAVPGAYINLGAHVQAPKLRGQLRQEKYIIDFPTSLAHKPSFEEDAYTSKVGGYPNWLEPSPGTEDFAIPSVPACKSCKKQMFLVTQICAPFDFPKTSAEFPTPSSCAAYLGNRTRHARTVYVFACNNARCGNAPGTWCTLSLCQGVGRDILEQSLLPAVEPVVVEDCESSDDEEEDLAHMIKGLSISQEDPAQTPCLPPFAGTAATEAEKKSQFAGMTKHKGVVVKADLFDMGGWSDDEKPEEEQEEEQEKVKTVSNCEPEMSSLDCGSDIEIDANVIAEELRPTAHANTSTSQALGADLAALSELLDRRDAEDRARAEALRAVREAEAVKQAEVQQRQEDAKPVLDKIMVSDKDTTVPTFRPFYLCWVEEPAAVKDDYHKEEALLQQYYLDNHEDTTSEESVTGKSSADDDAEERLESSADKILRRFTSRVQRQPDQCIRYWPKQPLALHQLPTSAEVQQIRQEMAQHPLEVYKTQSGIWGIHTVPDCETCGSPLKLEMQLMPNLLNELHVNDDDDFNPQNHALHKGMDWGLVDVYFCPMLCTPDEYVTSYCCVHPSI